MWTSKGPPHAQKNMHIFAYIIEPKLQPCYPEGMNLGRISPENSQFLSEYKRHGYSTKTAMADDALRVLRVLKAKARRRKWRREALQEYAGLNVPYTWEGLDGDDFAQDR